MTEIIQSSLFDYSQLDAETRITIKQRAERIQERNRTIALNIWENGRDLYEAQQQLAQHGYGCFIEWAESETGFSIRTVYNFIAVYQNFDCATVAQSKLTAKVLYLLAAPSTPEPARIEAIERAQAGESITHKTAQGIVNGYKPAPSLLPAPIKLQPIPAGEIVRTEVRFVPAKPFSETEYEEMAEELAEDEDGYTWQDNEDDTEEPQMITNIAPINKPHVAHNSGNNEWYTPEEYIKAARQVIGRIDLDPATSEIANTVVQADEFYTAQDNGLDQEWTGKVWMNPPYSSDLVGRFAEKLCRHYEAGDVTEAIVLVNNATETGWFQRMAQTASCVCFPRTRVKFWKPDGETGAPLQGQAILYFGTKKTSFVAAFRSFGFVGVINVI